MCEKGSNVNCLQTTVTLIKSPVVNYWSTDNSYTYYKLQCVTQSDDRPQRTFCELAIIYLDPMFIYLFILIGDQSLKDNWFLFFFLTK